MAPDLWCLRVLHGWWSVFGKKRGKNGKESGLPAHDDLVERDFNAGAPNEMWLTDITEHATGEGKIYLCAIKDVYSGRIVGYSISDRMDAPLAVDALRSAVQRRGGDLAGCVVHSDCGSHFRARKFLRELSRHNLVGSMGQAASAGDKESFFALLQNVLDRRRRTTTELRLAIVTWIELT